MKVTTLTEIAAVQTNHSVVFLLVCLEEDDVDQDWTVLHTLLTALTLSLSL